MKGSGSTTWKRPTLRQGRDNIGPNSINEYDFQYYDYERDRAGIGANIDLKADNDNKYYTNFMYSGL